MGIVKYKLDNKTIAANKSKALAMLLVKIKAPFKNKMTIKKIKILLGIDSLKDNANNNAAATRSKTPKIFTNIGFLK